jgi:hypothetical protein
MTQGYFRQNQNLPWLDGKSHVLALLKAIADKETQWLQLNVVQV